MTTVRDRLEEELKVTIARLRALTRAAEEAEAEPPSADEVFEDVDRIQLEQAREMRLVERTRLADRVNRLTAALRRMQAGEYGRCVDCGGRIAAARLRALPEVETCIACQERAEQERRFASLQAAGA